MATIYVYKDEYYPGLGIDSINILFEGREKQAMSIITKDRHEGLAPELAKILEKGNKLIPGKDEYGDECDLYAYVSSADCPFAIIKDGHYTTVRNFIPDTGKEIDWSKAKVKILKCSGESWYKNQVGCIFKVKRKPFEGVYVVDFNVPYGYVFEIKEEDCELITE
jgi:hypothetical protein